MEKSERGTNSSTEKFCCKQNTIMNILKPHQWCFSALLDSAGLCWMLSPHFPIHALISFSKQDYPQFFPGRDAEIIFAL